MKTATDDDYRTWAASLGEIEDRISIEQDAKRVFYANIRATHGKIAADAIKSAMRILRLADDKREQREQIDAQIAHIVQIVKSSGTGAPQEAGIGQAVEDAETVEAPQAMEEPTVEANEEPMQPNVPDYIKVKNTQLDAIEELVLDSAETYPEDYIEELVEAA